jgi:hypothetical protein
MDWKYIWKYWWEILMKAGTRAFKSSKVAAGIGYLFIAILAATIAYILFLVGWAAIDVVNQEILDIVDVWQNRVASVLIVFFGLFIIYLFTIPPELQNEKEKDVERLEKELSFKGYEDLEISPYDVPWTQQQRHVGMGGSNTVKIGLKLENKGNLKIRCRVKAVSLYYNGYGYHNWQGGEEWIDAPTPVEIRTIKWENEAESNIEIPSKSGFGNLYIAESLLGGSIGFRFCFADGNSDTHQLLDGRYCLNFQVEGDFEKNSLFEGFHPLKYQIVFKYHSHRLEFISVERNT